MLKKLIHEPLIHFLLFGGLIFLYYNYKTPQQTTLPKKKTITLSPYDIKALENDFSQQYDINLTQTLKPALIQKQFYDEVLLKEAFSLGLEKQDVSIRKKLLSKMDFILSNTTFKEPSQEELHKYYLQHIQDYTKKERLSFVYIKTDTKQKANKLYTILPFLTDTDKLTAVHNVSYPEIQQQYGRYFAQQLFLLKKGKWSQPIQTQDGFMLIKVISYDKLGEKQRFDDVEYQVYNDYKNDFIKENKEKKLQKILKRYQLDIQKND